jgi:hypothetical protein
MMRRGTLAPAAIALVLAVLAVLFAACGGGSGPGVASVGKSTSTTVATSAGSSGGPLPPAQVALQVKFVDCMRRDGVSAMPDPQPSGGFNHSALNVAAGIPASQGVGAGQVFSQFGVASPQFKKALKACNSSLIAAGFVHTAAQIARWVAQSLKISKCMRSHGVANFPDPNSQGNLMVSESVEDEPAYPHAAKVCGAPPRAPASYFSRSKT